jgi:hypothetical protein
MMRRYSTILRSLVCLALVATAAWAEEKVPNDVPGEGIVANCDLTGYKSEVRTFNPGIAVPDNNPAGVTTPAIQFAADGSTIADVVIDILMTHTWIGDIVATVQYDETCDGTVDATSVVICRPRGPAAGHPAPCGTTATAGCSGDLTTASRLLFDDSAVNTLAEGAAACTTTIPGGCYRPSTGGGTPLARFRGMRKDGCWTLNVSDRAGLDTGVILEWSVHLRNQTIGVEQSSWTQVKTLFE